MAAWNFWICVCFFSELFCCFVWNAESDYVCIYIGWRSSHLYISCILYFDWCIFFQWENSYFEVYICKVNNDNTDLWIIFELSKYEQVYICFSTFSVSVFWHELTWSFHSNKKKKKIKNNKSLNLRENFVPNIRYILYHYYLMRYDWTVDSVDIFKN